MPALRALPLKTAKRACRNIVQNKLECFNDDSNGAEMVRRYGGVVEECVDSAAWAEAEARRWAPVDELLEPLVEGSQVALLT
eukprot:SAG11_NODE_691_length_7699_cov_3.868026_5_plen_82_part_00